MADIIAAMLKGLDLDDFWEDPKHSRDYVEGPITPALLRSVEKELGFRLPRAFIALMRRQNGGHPKRTLFPTKKPTSWAKDHIAITGFLGIGRKKPFSLLGSLGSRFAQEERGYPTFGVCICDCPSAGHDMVMLDYRACGPTGEPAVIHVDQELDFRITELAPDFETFVRGLYADDHPDDELEALRHVIKTGRLSPALTRLLARSSAPRKTERMLRSMLDLIVVTSGKLVLDGSPFSYLIYDLLFSLFAAAHTVDTPRVFLDAYPDLLVFGDGEASTAGQKPSILAKWMKGRLARGEIVERRGTLALSVEHRAAMEAELAEYARRYT